jgi:hypothetical protein
LSGKRFRDFPAKSLKFSPVERKDHLIPIRNKLKHVREDEIEPTALLKAQVFCIELLESLSSLPDQNDIS